MSIRSPEIDGKAIVAVGILALFVVAGVAGTATATSSNYGFLINQTEGESVEIVIVDTGNADSISLGAPNGNRSIPLNESQGFGIRIVDDPENRTVPAENYLTTGATKTEEQTCWVSFSRFPEGYGGVELGDGIRVNRSVDIPCNGGEIAGPQNLESVGHSEDAVLIKPGEEIEYQDGTYGMLVEVDGEERVVDTFTVGSGGPSFETNYDRHYDTNNGNTLYSIIILAALLAMAVVMAALFLRWT
jgi:hypothetical protein